MFSLYGGLYILPCLDARPELHVGFVTGQGLFNSERALLLRSNSILCNKHSLALDRTWFPSTYSSQQVYNAERGRAEAPCGTAAR